MSNFILNQVVVGDTTVVRYLMKQKGGNVTGHTSMKSAMWMLTNDRAKVPHITEEFPGYPLTADGVYFFDGEMGDEKTTSSASLRSAPSPEWEDSGAAVEIGADGLPLPAGAEKPKRKKRAKDVVCE